MPDREYEFEVALSFAGENREYVREVRDKLVKRGRKVFFDEDRLAEMWGEELPEYFQDVFQNRSRYAAPFISATYVERTWPRVERRSALARALEQKDPYLLPVRLDDTVVPGFSTTMGYIDTRKTGIDRLVELIIEKLDGTPQPATVWDGRVPRTAEHSAILLRKKPGSWEYLLFAGTLAQSVRALEPKYRDHELSYARPSGIFVSNDDAVEYVQRAFTKLMGIVDAVNLLFAPAAFERAFGEPGAEGDPERIDHLARRTVAMYEDLMDWAADLRGVYMASKYKPLVDIAARFADEPIEEFRQYVDDLVEKVDTIPDHYQKPEPREQLVLEVSLRLTMDQKVLDEFTAETARLSRL